MTEGGRASCRDDQCCRRRGVLRDDGAQSASRLSDVVLVGAPVEAGDPTPKSSGTGLGAAARTRRCAVGSDCSAAPTSVSFSFSPGRRPVNSTP